MEGSVCFFSHASGMDPGMATLQPQSVCEPAGQILWSRPKYLNNYCHETQFSSDNFTLSYTGVPAKLLKSNQP